MKLSKSSILMAILIVMASCKKDSSTSTSSTSSSSSSSSIGGSTTTGTSTTGLGTADDTGCPTSTGANKVACLAQAFLATLSTSQQSTVSLSLTLANAKNWSNLPISLAPRNGIQFSTLTSAQLSAALAVIKTASGTGYSMEGFEKFQTIRAADDYLATMQSGYGDGNYFIAFLGTPSNSGKWMLQYGGHHYAANIMFSGGAVVEITPLHEGVEPHIGFTVNNVTYTNPLSNNVTAIQAMMGSFTSANLVSAKISGTFSDCLMIPGSTSNTMPTVKQGVKVSTLSADAQAKVYAAMTPWINDVDSTQAATIRAAYKSELADTYVCYANNTSAVAGTASSFMTAATDYVRIDGPTVWIEICCQNGIVIQNQIHYHTVMRDHSRDYLGL